jgi:ubiquinone/menaquinone biosynthesis C-methylase UbiE
MNRTDFISYDKSATQEFFDAHGKDYYRRNYETPNDRHAYNLFVRREISLSLLENSERVVLDLGCGPGALALTMLEMGKTVCGLDLSHTMVEQAAQAVNRMGSGLRSLFCTGNAIALPFQNDSFDLVTSTGVIEYIPEPHCVLAEIHRVLKPGGVVIATSSPPRHFEKFVTKTVSCLLSKSRESNVWHRQYSPARFDELLLDAEFTVETRRYSFFLPFPLDVFWPRLVKRLDSAVAGTLRQSRWGRPLAKTYIVKARKHT